MSLPQYAAPKVAAGTNAEGCIEVFYSKNDNSLCYRSQIEAGGSWSDEEVYSFSVTGVYMEEGPDGLLELFYIDSNNDLYHAKQHSSDYSWPLAVLFRENVSALAFTTNTDDYLQLFCILEDHSVTCDRPCVFPVPGHA